MATSALSKLNTEPSGGKMRLYQASAVFAVTCLAALAIDARVATLGRAGHVPGDFKRLLDFSEVFAHGAGVAMILLTAWVLDPKNRRRLVRVAASAYGAGLVVDCLKLSLPRTRPHAVDFTSLDSIWHTFHAPMPLLRGDYAAAFDHARQSMPSGHTATAVGLAIGLSHLYPRGVWLFGAFAAMAAMQRVAASAHFPSDVAAGASVAFLIGAACHDRLVLGRFFDRWETPRPSSSSTA